LLQFLDTTYSHPRHSFPVQAQSIDRIVQVVKSTLASFSKSSDAKAVSDRNTGGEQHNEGQACEEDLHNMVIFFLVSLSQSSVVVPSFFYLVFTKNTILVFCTNFVSSRRTQGRWA
jgi:hypothetical protein